MASVLEGEKYKGTHMAMSTFVSRPMQKHVPVQPHAATGHDLTSIVYLSLVPYFDLLVLEDTSNPSCNVGGKLGGPKQVTVADALLIARKDH